MPRKNLEKKLSSGSSSDDQASGAAASRHASAMPHKDLEKKLSSGSSSDDQALGAASSRHDPAMPHKDLEKKLSSGSASAMPHKDLEKKLSSGSLDDQEPDTSSKHRPAKRRACSESPKSKRSFIPRIFRARESRAPTSDGSGASVRSKSEGCRLSTLADEQSSGDRFGTLVDMATKEVKRTHRGGATAAESSKKERPGKASDDSVPSSSKPNIARLVKYAKSKLGRLISKTLPGEIECDDEMALVEEPSPEPIRRSGSYRIDSKHIEDETFQDIMTWAPQTDYEKETPPSTEMITDSTSLVGDTDSQHSLTSSAQERLDSIVLDPSSRAVGAVSADPVSSKNSADFGRQQDNPMQEDVAGESMDIEGGDEAVCKATDVPPTSTTEEVKETKTQSKRKYSGD